MLIPLPNGRMDTASAERLIHQLAEDSANIKFTLHARERMELRSISSREVERVLRRGSVLQPPEPTTKGEWKCKIVRESNANRDIGVITVIADGEKLIIITVEWEDLP